MANYLDSVNFFRTTIANSSETSGAAAVASSDRKECIRKHVRHIQEEILNLRCPKCMQVFTTFDGCFALHCHRCQTGFCAWCLGDCHHDAHGHVSNCIRNPKHGTKTNHQYFNTIECFEQVHIMRRGKAVVQYVANIEDKRIAREVAESIKPECKRLGFSLDYAASEEALKSVMP
ncbi:hypothetical protein SARC_11891 [Sphaeroforma arctica JP610]|uniref:IBR domain-containing protein n=1 Tax=Sphaeroforma arctica JP610 TaxID=667725 RepID=A0A0L0FHV2_9EUKA|nr:hypothetical protein SARC_11891 [Sphaeroforma arctica JP610]KNC75588.1 hypothetical protein SARC_11891 [Sphaeroforma arctica JP610]|eukprot:XP_014149490.1 hypothetical protein SARC_11891 [Sphaeroforma arctica JP610]